MPRCDINSRSPAEGAIRVHPLLAGVTSHRIQSAGLMQVASSGSALDEVRSYLSKQLESGASKHEIAREIGLNPQALERVLEGGARYSRTRARLFEWWDRQQDPPFKELTPDISAAFGDLLNTVPKEMREELQKRMVTMLRRLHAAHPACSPSWVGELVRIASAPTSAGRLVRDPSSMERDSRECHTRAASRSGNNEILADAVKDRPQILIAAG